LALVSDWRRRTFSSLSDRNYRAYFLGSAVSVSGTWMQRVAQDWLVLQLTHSGVALGIASALQFAPILVLGAWGGAVIDRVDRRRLLLLTQILSALLAAVLGLAFAINALSFVAMIVALASMNVGALLRVSPTPRAPRQIREGLAYLWSHGELRASLILVAVVGVFGQNFRVVLPLLAQNTYPGGAQSYGCLTAALGLGAVIGALGSAARGRSSVRGLLLTCLAFGGTNLLVAVMPSFVLALAVFVGHIPREPSLAT
jgi:Transmembrane secretion effector